MIQFNETKEFFQNMIEESMKYVKCAFKNYLFQTIENTWHTQHMATKVNKVKLQGYASNVCLSKPK